VIAAGFVAGAAIEAGLAPLAGRYSDRVGRSAPFAVGLVVAAVGMLTIGLGAAVAVVVGGLLIGSAGGGICFTPAWALLSETAEASRLHQGFAAGLSNMAWASGQMIGGLVGGGLASFAGYAAPSLAIVALLLATAAYARNGLSTSRTPAEVG
jgi:MFS transporter, DHA1 family, multidrug resistance protein